MTPQLLLALTAVFIASTLLCAGVLMAYFALTDEQRIRAALESKTAGVLRTSALGKLDGLAGPANVSKPVVARGSTKARLAMAGITHPMGPTIYSAAEVAATVVLGALPVVFMGVSLGWLFAILGALVGYMLPGLLLGRMINGRKVEITNGLPDVLDLLVLCLEAGSSLNQAIVRATDDLRVAYPALADELRQVTAEIRAGKPRVDAFRSFEQRTKVDDVRTLVSMIAQTDRFGTSVAQALRTQANVGRIKRRQRAEERAGRVGVKLVFPLVFCLFPALYVVVLGPAIIKFSQVFGH